ncbi:C-X-C chemokine receptor type 3-like [Poeciliopsis prolifica]|uniref:C-X-C chemokine receptor type 3-like n=1 Tax=Poeciliopsis prolifica TaxID=188132 RepID=UPI00241386A7|nr:C-X-C chemokine receptor type 3-like [Poeciliopsis prolifica]
MEAPVMSSDEYPWWHGYIYNFTYSYDQDYEDEVCDMTEYINFANVFIPVTFSVVFVVGMLGNGLLLGVLMKSRKAWSTTDFLILHRAVADILLLVTLPFRAVESASDAGWMFGTFFCKVTGSVLKINFYCGIFLLACLSVSYLLSIIPSTKEVLKKKPWVVHFCCVVVWILSILLSIPEWIFFEAMAEEKNRCIRNVNVHTYTFLQGLNSTFGFVFPLVVLVFCFFCIVWQLQCGTKGLQNQRDFKVVIVVAAVFFVCWTPFNITTWVFKNSGYHCNTSLDVADLVTYAVRHFHCFLHPIVFLLVDVKNRQQQHVDQDMELTAQLS